MTGTFDRLSDLEWKLFTDLFPPEPLKRGHGMPHTPFRNVVNTLLYVLITVCRWCDLPRGPQWASKSAAHRWLQRWHTDGTLAGKAKASSSTASRTPLACHWPRAPRLPMGTSGPRASRCWIPSTSARANRVDRANDSRCWRPIKVRRQRPAPVPPHTLDPSPDA
jgi:Putative transposase of IS4/5 family (DUF4096)